MTDSTLNPVYHSEIIKTNGVNLHVVQVGPEDGPLVILLHGFPEFWYGWRHQIPALTEAGFRVWAPDQRGYNESDKPPEIRDYAIPKLVADIAGLVARSGRDKAHIIGHDWGAMVAWSLALMEPQVVDRLVILNVPHPQVFRETLLSNVGQMLKSWYAGMFQLPLLPEMVASIGDYEIFLRSIRDTANKGTFSLPELERYRAAWKRTDAMRSMIHWYRAAARYYPDYPTDIVNAPTLMIWGKGDRFLDVSMTRPSIEKCRDGRLVIIDDATHWVQHDKPEQVNTLILDFLRD